ncbi:hypothetical protein B0T19DRAFT_361556 [Cercophora scortea]|uniref:Monooxygenase n=1 Tax=Cercophora scortea TaxID=314031 RepID=A0AAE0M523_9PEZI|nr:hypothetical protein B0T19DRAFT_361556 [Cercophora scortea]
MGSKGTTATADDAIPYSQFACIGAGFSGIGLGAQLQRWYGITDIRFFDRYSDLGGTWLVNRYPGCACDVPSALYSFSFEQNANWTRVLATADEIWAYQKAVADKYDLVRRMTFNASVERCEWLETTSRWRLHIRDTTTDTVFLHECQFLLPATGYFSAPRALDIPGASTFQGPVIHSARWPASDGGVDLTNKRVVLFGNGCTGAQIVPAILHETKHLTQIVRSKHWIMPPVDSQIPAPARFLLNYLPGAAALQRLVIYCIVENGFRAFSMTKRAARFREGVKTISETYMRTTAPEKYHDMLIPDFEIGCKRRIYDSTLPGYLPSLHAANMTLTDEAVVEIVPNGVRMASGEIVQADVIILANGFKTNNYLGGVEVVGRDGETLEQHWDDLGGPSAYNCSAMSGFPNFFMLAGPNTATGHTSVLLAAENSINYALRIIKPVLEGKASTVTVDRAAEESYVQRVQGALRKTVWATGCRSWYLKRDVAADGTEKVWNGTSYPYSQQHFWYRSLFPVWRDWRFGVSHCCSSSSSSPFSLSFSNLPSLNTQPVVVT